MAQPHNFRFLCLLLAGGLVFSYLTGYPRIFLEEKGVIPADAAETMASVSADDLPQSRDEEKKEDGSISENTVSGNSVSENSVSANSAVGEESENIKPAEFCSVEDDYFSDACFIGDSRVVSLYLYSDWKDATYYCSSGMTLGGVFGEPSTKFKDGNWKVNIATALQHSHYGKIYIMVGINDMGVGGLDYFVERYQDMINKIHKWQPDAVIYIQSIMNVSAARSAQGDYITNEAIRIRNAKLKEMDNGIDIFYLDVNSVVCDESGALNAAYTFDGVHLYARYVALWTDYLKTHAIVR